MPTPKKGGRGGKREGTGRKSAGPQSKFSSTEERNDYQRERRAEERGQVKEPQKRSESSRWVTQLSMQVVD